jgi:hypothetical protein
VSETPIIPTRIIPAGAPLPDRGPLPGELPPWWKAPTPPPPPPPPVVTAPPAPAPPPPDPQIHVHVVIPYEEPPEPTRRERLWAWLRTIGRPWQVCGALTLALLPIPGVGYSAATIWASCVHLTRTEWGQGTGYALALALTPLVIAVMRITHSGGTLRRLLLLAVSLVGLTGAIDLYDPVTWITGVSR